MSSRNSSSQLLSLVGGFVAIILVVVVAWLLLHPALTVVEPASSPKGYSTAVIDTLAKQGSVLDKISDLQEVVASQPAAIQYAPSDLGKDDLTKSE